MVGRAWSVLLISHFRHLSFSVFNDHFPVGPGLAGFTAAKDDGSDGNNWSYKTCKAPVKSSPTDQHLTSNPSLSQLDTTAAVL